MTALGESHDYDLQLLDFKKEPIVRHNFESLSTYKEDNGLSLNTTLFYLNLKRVKSSEISPMIATLVLRSCYVNLKRYSSEDIACSLSSSASSFSVQKKLKCTENENFICSTFDNDQTQTTVSSEFSEIKTVESAQINTSDTDIAIKNVSKKPEDLLADELNKKNTTPNCSTSNKVFNNPGNLYFIIF